MSEQYLLKLQEYFLKNPNKLKMLAKVVNLASKCIALFWMCIPDSKNKSFKVRRFARHTQSKLLSKQVKYLQYIKQVQDEHGFIDSNECDSLLFSGLVGCAGVKVDITAARDSKGQWFRRPLSNPCYPNGSKSTISRDMLLGLLWYIWSTKQLKLAEELFAYGKKNDWVMGEGDPARIYMTPGLQATLAEIIYRLGGKNHFIYRNQMQVWPKGLDDYQAHLDVLHILLRGELLGYITDPMKKSLKRYHDAEPNNALFEYGHHLYKDGSMVHAVSILFNTKWFPKDRLPTEKDRSTGWLFQRNYMKGDSVNPDWLPGKGEHTHSGGEFLFTAYLITRL